MREYYARFCENLGLKYPGLLDRNTRHPSSPGSLLSTQTNRMLLRTNSLLILSVVAFISACDTTQSDPGNDNGGPSNGNDDIPDQTYNPNIPDDYSQYTDFSNRDYWGPYNLHDPGCLPDGEWVYCYSTDASYGNEADKAGAYIQIRRSTDLVQWEFSGWALQAIPDEARQYVTDENDGVVPGGIWAPFIMKTDDTYRLYYSVSVFASNASYIGLLTSDSPMGPWEDQGEVVKTNHSDDRNAIDPTVVVDPATGRYWFAYGSHWTGIYILELDPATGKPLVKNDLGHRIASSSMPFNAIEAPEIIYHEGFDMYYLFVSYGDLMDEYSVRVGRADHPEGPYIDFFGNDMAANSNNSPVLISPYRFSSHSGWQGLGHNTVFSVGGQWYSMQQGRLGSNVHMMVMHLRKILWTEDGWPVFSPQRYANVPQDPIEGKNLIGEWEEITLNPLSGNGVKNLSAIIELNSDGSVSGTEAEWDLESENRLVIRESDSDNGQIFYLSREWDWERDRLSIVFTGLNEDGVTVWGKRVY